MIEFLYQLTIQEQIIVLMLLLNTATVLKLINTRSNQ